MVLVVVAVLAAIALPSYQDHVRKGRRAAALSHLLDIAQHEQQYLLDKRQFANTLADLNVTTPSEVSDYYTIAIDTTNGPPPTFKANADPIPGKAQSGDLSGAQLSITNSGDKLPVGAW